MADRQQDPLPDVSGNEITFGNRTVGWYKWASWFSQKIWESRVFQHLNTAAAAFAILCKGDELGLPPFAAWTWIYQTKAGRLAIQSKGALAVVQASPNFAGYEERIEQEGTPEMRGVAIATRQGHKPYIKEFTLKDAEVAGLLREGVTREGGKYETTYKLYLKDMLQARARGRVLDIAFAMELGGIALEGIAEDAERVAAQRPTPAAAPESSLGPPAVPPRRDPLLALVAPKELVAGDRVPEVDPAFVKVISDQVDEMFGPSGAPAEDRRGQGREETSPAADTGPVASGPPPAAGPKARPPAAPGDPKPPAGKAKGGGPSQCPRCGRAPLNALGGCDVCAYPGQDIR
jgi:hypothetical protein